MIDKQDFVLACSFIVANSAITALLGDWFVFLGNPQQIAVSNNTSCEVFRKESYNLFGAICGVNLNDIEPIATTLQTLLSINLAFALLLYFLVTFRRMKRNMIRVSIVVIMGLSLTSVILWAVEDKERLPTDSKKINMYGAGWIAAIICAASTLPLFMV